MNSNEFELSSQQLSFFNTFGFLTFPGLLADRIETIIEEFENLWAAQGGGHHGSPHDHQHRSCIVPFIDRSEILSSLLDDPRILGIATSLIGNDFNYTASDGNLYASDTGWHSDGQHRDIRHIKFAFYLDPVTRDSGCLRVMPGSHHLDDDYAKSLQDQLGNSSSKLWSVHGHGRDLPAVALETQPGDLVCFNHNTKHAAFGGTGRRRMFTMNCCERYPVDRLQELRDFMAGLSRFWVDGAYGQTMITTAGPQRMVHLEQCLANDGHLAELSRKAREDMLEPSRG